MTETARRIAEIEAVGFTTIPDFLDAATLAEARAALEPHLDEYLGRNDFEGELTERVYALAARAPIFSRIALDPRMLALCDAFLQPGYLLTGSQSIRIHPGETPQPFHADDSFYPIPRPRKMFSLAIILAIDAFTAENGATELIPGSHLWSDEQVRGIYHLGGNEPGPSPESRMAPVAQPALLPAGGAIVFSGTLIHRGGANRSRVSRMAITNQYCEPWARTQENFCLGVPKSVMRGLPPRLQQLMGYSIYPPFMGHVVGRHPLKTLEADYVSPIPEN